VKQDNSTAARQPNSTSDEHDEHDESAAHPSHQQYAEQREIRSLGGRFFFPIKLSAGQHYSVQVVDHPRDQKCTVEAASASGVVVVAGGAAQYDDARAGLRRGQVVKIRCFYKGRWKFVLGGQVTGLTADTTLVLTSATAVTGSETGTPGAAGRKNVSISRLIITSDGHFTFPEQEVAETGYVSLPAGAAPRSAAGPAAATEHTTAEQMSYDVAIAKAPSNQDCAVSFGEGLAVVDEGSDETRLMKVRVACKSKLAKNKAEGGEGKAGAAAAGASAAGKDEDPENDRHLEWFSEGCECMRCDGSKAHFQPHSVCHGESSGCVQDDPYEGCYGQQTIRPYHTGTCECSTETFLKPEIHRIGGTLRGLEPGQSVVLSSSSPKMIDNEKASDDSLAVQHLSLHKDGKFSFPRLLADDQGFFVAVIAQPEGQHCAATMGGLDMDGIQNWGPVYVDITDLQVRCRTLRGYRRPAHAEPMVSPREAEGEEAEAAGVDPSGDGGGDMKELGDDGADLEDGGGLFDKREENTLMRSKKREEIAAVMGSDRSDDDRHLPIVHTRFLRVLLHAVEGSADYLAFATFAAYDQHGHELKLTVYASSSEFANGAADVPTVPPGHAPQWSAAATLDNLTSTCYSSATPARELEAKVSILRQTDCICSLSRRLNYRYISIASK
jgi:hypothetical protein